VLSIGIDVAEERKGLDVVALGTDRRVERVLSRATVADVVAMTHELSPGVVCIDSPPAWAADGKSRAGERELRRLGITAFSTPTDPGDHAFYRWMRVGFSIFDAIAGDYPRFRGDAVSGTAAEVFPEATAVLLAGRLRSVDESKIRFRRDVLDRHGVDTSGLRRVDAVDAALAALTGVLALAGESSFVGDPAEGVILLPVAELPVTKLLRKPASSAGRSSTRPRSVLLRAQRPTTWCECGCGAEVRRRFLPGHDAKLRSQLRRRHLGGDEVATERLIDLGWHDAVET
jgi:predicted nuclease with RNAse H fold